MKTGTCLKALERVQADDSRGHARGCGSREEVEVNKEEQSE